MTPITEEQMWDIIDGVATPEIIAQHELLLKNDAQYKASFETLMRLQTQLLQLDLEQPSMRFTQNVLDKVTPPLKTVTKLDKVSWFFMVSIFSMLVVFLAFILLTNQGNTNGTLSIPNTEKINEFLTNPIVVPLFLVINLGLLFSILDKWILKTFFRKSNSV